MSLYDLDFIFRFLPGFLILYYICPAHVRKALLFIGCLVFYAFGDVRYLALLFMSVVFNYYLGKDVYFSRKASLFLAVFTDVLLLAAFKALGFFFSSSFLPMGISFYIFKMISYQVDLYTGKVKAFPSFLDAAVYFTLFSQVISGPIMRYPESASNPLFLKKSERPADCESVISRLEKGAFYFCMGLTFKIIMADHLASAFNQIGTIGYAHISVPLAWLGVVIYSLNLYYDFWGYSLMALGVSLSLGFPMVQNFNHPYAAKSVTDFYRRWHMKLGAWFKDCVYIPLGGSKKGNVRTFFNLFIVWLLTGLWHGFSFNFLLWAGILFLLIVWEKFVLSRAPKLLNVLGRFHVLFIIPLTWIVFALSRTDYLISYLNCLFPFFYSSPLIYRYDYVTVLADCLPYTVLGIAGLFPFVYSSLEKNRRHPLVVILMLVLFWLCVYSITGRAANPFMYGRF